MRVVLDTNVLVSAFLYGGQPLDILDLVEQGLFEAITCEEALSELRDVLIRDKFFERLGFLGLKAEDVVSAYREIAILVTPDTTIDICEDTSDNLFIGIALAGNAHIIISGDKHLLNCSDRSPVPILRASEFLDLLREMKAPSDYCAENTKKLLEFVRTNHDIRLVGTSAKAHEGQFSIRYTENIEQRVQQFAAFLSEFDAKIVGRHDYPPHNVLIFVQFPPESFNFNWQSDGLPVL